MIVTSEWLAGHFEAAGEFKIHDAKGNPCAHVCRVFLRTPCQALAVALHEKYGGNYSEAALPSWYWSVVSHKAFEVASALEPFLWHKKADAQRVIRAYLYSGLASKRSFEIELKDEVGDDF